MVQVDDETANTIIKVDKTYALSAITEDSYQVKLCLNQVKMTNKSDGYHL